MTKGMVLVTKELKARHEIFKIREEPIMNNAEVQMEILHKHAEYLRLREEPLQGVPRASSNDDLLCHPSNKPCSSCTEKDAQIEQLKKRVAELEANLKIIADEATFSCRECPAFADCLGDYGKCAERIVEQAKETE